MSLIVERKSANLKQRQQGKAPEVIAYAGKANDRLRRKYVRIATRSKADIAKTAVARELACFVWGIRPPPLTALRKMLLSHYRRRTQKHIDPHCVAGKTMAAFFSGWLSRADRLRRWLSNPARNLKASLAASAGSPAVFGLIQAACEIALLAPSFRVRNPRRKIAGLTAQLLACRQPIFGVSAA